LFSRLGDTKVGQPIQGFKKRNTTRIEKALSRREVEISRFALRKNAPHQPVADEGRCGCHWPTRVGYCSTKPGPLPLMVAVWIAVNFFMSLRWLKSG